MTRKVLTDRTLRALKPAQAGARNEIKDAIVPGLAVRVTSSGKRTFVLRTRYPNERHASRRALGEYGVMTLDEARERAREWLGQIKSGIDPVKHAAEVKAEQRAAEQRKQKNSFENVAEEFIARHVMKNRKGEEVARDIRREFVARFGERPITEVTRHDVRAVIEAAVDRGAPYQAHNLLVYIRRLFNWAIGRDAYGLESSPVDRLKPADLIGAKQARDRILDNEELRAFWKSIAELGYPYDPIYRLLILTGLRLNEVADASWPEFDLAARTWTIPAARMKGREGKAKPHLVPLTDEMMSIIDGLPRFEKGPFLFSTTFGEKPVHVSRKVKIRLDALMRASLSDKLADWRNHDLRRTVRSGLSALRVAEEVREALLAHVRPGIKGVYDVYSYQDEKAEALKLWSLRLHGIVEPPPENVVKLKARRAK